MGRNPVRQRGLHQLPEIPWLVQLHLPVPNGAIEISEITRFPPLEHDRESFDPPRGRNSPDGCIPSSALPTLDRQV